MRDEINWTGRNPRRVSDFLFPMTDGAFVVRADVGRFGTAVSLQANGVVYDLPVGCRIVRTDDGTVTVDATGCEDAGIEWLDDGEVWTTASKTWVGLCEPRQVAAE